MEVEDDDKVEEGQNWEKEDEMKRENLMPRMKLRVLLVEADDSTRQIIGVLLRNCNYKVAAISDGLKAWEILKHRNNNIDLILTELDLPSISGYALLTLIMEHDSCKHIPVIIMSSQDSVNMVLKCILKGAADFLIKPVRKNELKNLWRHVWRKLTNNAGHNSHNITAEQHKNEVAHENIPAINHSEDNVSSSFKGSRFSEKSIDSNGLSWMKHMEVDGLCREKEKVKAKNVKVEEGVSLYTSIIEDKSRSDAQPSKEVNVLTNRVEEDGSNTGIATEDGRSYGPGDHTYRDSISSHELCESSIEAVDLIGRINEQSITTVRTSSIGDSNGKITNPELELSLKRFLNSEVKDVCESPILNHSSASAFSRYTTNKKSRTIFASSDGELPKIESVADSSSCPKPFSSYGENKPNTPLPQTAPCDTLLGPLSGPFDSGVWASYGNVSQPMCSSHKGPTSRIPNSAYKLRNSQVVDPSGSGTQCNDIGSQNKNIAQGSGSEITDVNTITSGMKGTSFVEDSEDCKPFIYDEFRSKMGLYSAERKAALAKFRQKRKGRCYEKKVRYESRKRQAAQRPRVKGQFVRQIPCDRVLDGKS